MLNQLLKGKQVILASGSPRRQQFFKELGIAFKIELRPIEEIYEDHLKGHQISDFLAELKASIYKKDLQPQDILITSDTIVIHEGQCLGKPKDEKEAFNMLQSMSNKTHEVISSVCFTTSTSQQTIYASTAVTFKELSKEEIEYYIENYKPYDKAGAYGIQEWIGAIGITEIKGSYNNVMGLPTHMVYKTLAELAS